MLTILINAYACGPNRGSEPGMAWNWCCHLAKHCVLHIITEGEFREDIERVLPTLEHGHNMRFYYLPVGKKIRRMCWNQGDWRFYYYYAKWQKRALNEALRIIASTQIDVLHQLNMIGFREPGYLYSIKRIPLVWGPIGGIKQFPLAYARGGGLRLWMFSAIKNILNRLQLEYAPRINKAFKRADILVSSIPDSQTGIKKYVRRDSILIPETGCFESWERDETRSHNFENVTFRILWIGKFDFRKRLDIAIKAIGAANLPNVHLKVFGTGNKEQIKAAKNLVDRLGLHGQVHLMGAVSNDRIMQEMREADLFFFSSINEDTSTVVLEAVSNHLPVLCFDCCGMAAVIDSTVGVKVPLTNPEQSVKDFAERIDYLYHHRDELKRMSEGCKAKRQELSWEKKAEQMVEVYHKAMAEHSEN